MTLKIALFVIGLLILTESFVLVVYPAMIRKVMRRFIEMSDLGYRAWGVGVLAIAIVLFYSARALT